MIGITGGIGSGKSEILQFFKREYSACILEADKIAYYLEQPGMHCYQKIIEEFGSGILKKDGTIERSRLGEIVFADRSRLDKLNQIVHPEVKKYIINMIETVRTNQSTEYCIIEAALFFEDKYDMFCDEVWYIHVNEATRIKRLMAARGYTQEKIRKIINMQLKEEEFRRYCKVVIDNNGDIEQTFKQIREELKCQNR